MSTSENSQKNKANLKLFGIIVAAIIVALVSFTVGKDAWDSHQANVAKEQASKQEASRQAVQNQQQKLAKEKEDQLEQLKKNKLAYEDQIVSLRKLWVSIVNERKRIEGISAQDKATNRNSVDLPVYKEELKKDVEEYNTIAASIPPDILRSPDPAYAPNGYPLKFDENGNQV